MPAAYEACGCQARDYVAVDTRGKFIAGPYKSYSDAKIRADRAGGYVQFAAESAGEEVPVPVVEPQGCRPWIQIQKDPRAFDACMQLAQKLGPIEGHDRLYAIVREQMQREDQEVFYAILLDTQLQLRGLTEIARGARDRVPTPIPDIARSALTGAVHLGAMGLGVAHCHPSGKPHPSKADHEVTRSVETMCSTLGILFVDHIVVGSQSRGYYSFRAKKAFRPR